MNVKRLVREQVDEQLAKLKSNAAPLPQKGWIRTVRRALGMSARQLGDRIGMTQQAVASLEKSEAQGKISLATLRRVAEAMDCVVVYAIVPNTTLDDTLRRQARKVAANRVARVSHSMTLEDQALDREKAERAIERHTQELIDRLPPTLWNRQ